MYVFSDGYPDQFGGEKGKKFKYSRLKELITTINEQPMSDQKKLLLTQFENWKGDHEQVDDVCIMGIRV